MELTAPPPAKTSKKNEEKKKMMQAKVIKTDLNQLDSTSGVNFTNFFWAAFAPIFWRQKSFNLKSKYKNFCAKHSYEKGARIMLMKLTPGCRLTTKQKITQFGDPNSPRKLRYWIFWRSKHECSRPKKFSKHFNLKNNFGLRRAH